MKVGDGHAGLSTSAWLGIYYGADPPYGKPSRNGARRRLRSRWVSEITERLRAELGSDHDPAISASSGRVPIRSLQPQRKVKLLDAIVAAVRHAQAEAEIPCIQ
jgi:hypothetical protein